MAKHITLPELEFSLDELAQDITTKTDERFYTKAQIDENIYPATQEEVDEVIRNLEDL